MLCLCVCLLAQGCQGATGSTQRLLCSGSSKIGGRGVLSDPEQKWGRKDHIKTNTCLIKEA